MSAAELNRQRTPEGQADQMRPVQPEAHDEAGQAIGVARHPKPIGRIR